MFMFISLCPIQVSNQKGEIETSYTSMMGEKVKLQAQIELLNQQLASRVEVRTTALYCTALYCAVLYA
jgi:hypothetical protein